MYGNVVQAICAIASACSDEKISALAQSVLLQKIDKIAGFADTQIIPGAAVLGLDRRPARVQVAPEVLHEDLPPGCCGEPGEPPWRSP